MNRSIYLLICRLIGDGIAIEYSGGVDGLVGVCLVGRALSNDTITDTEEYPVLDFASSDETYEKFEFSVESSFIL